MRKTIKYKTVGQYMVIDSFDELPIDPAQTEIANRNAIESLPEKLAIDSKMEELAVLRDNPVQPTFEQVEQFNSELKALHDAFEICKNACINSNLIYAHPRANEVALTDSQYEQIKAMYDQKGKNKQVIIDIIQIESTIEDQAGNEFTVLFPQLSRGAELIDDFIGCQYFYQDIGGIWIASDVISELGINKSMVVPDEELENAIESKDLTAEQREEIRIQGLTDEQKLEEKAVEIQRILSLAGQMRSELEILNDPDALTKAQDFYTAESAIIQQKYIII